MPLTEASRLLMDMNACYKSAPRRVRYIYIYLAGARLNARSFIMRRIFGLFRDCDPMRKGRFWDTKYVTRVAKNATRNHANIARRSLEWRSKLKLSYERRSRNKNVSVAPEKKGLDSSVHCNYSQNLTLFPLVLGFRIIHSLPKGMRESWTIQAGLGYFLGYDEQLPSFRWMWILYSIVMEEYQGSCFLVN